MNQQLKTILDTIQQNKNLNDEEKAALVKTLNAVEKELEITAFKLERTEKVKRTTTILLEETIEELEQKRKVVEEQVREAQIEAALERVRARTMAMQDSSELAETATILFQELKRLGILSESARAFFRLFDAKAGMSNVWTTREDGVLRPGSHQVPLTENQSVKNVYDAWKAKKSFFVRELCGQALADYLKFLSTLPHVKDDRTLKQFTMTPPELLVLSEAFNLYGTVGIISFTPLDRESQNVLIRFARVFEQTYTRFLDFQKAEAQAREAQIEASLERVRSRSMAMHKSDELQEVINRLIIEILSLGVQAKACYIITDLDEDITKGQYIWVQNDEQLYAEKMYLPYLDHPMFHNFHNAWRDRKPFYTEMFTKKEKNRLFNHFFKHSPQLMAIPDERKRYILDGSGFSRSVMIYKSAAFIIQKYDDKPFEAEEINIQKRFGQVFEQTYTRFLDLQKAEAQAREAQIEAALERVRSRSMAMHNSNELHDVIEVVTEQLSALGITFDHATFFKEDADGNLDLWISTPRQAYPAQVHFPYFDHKVFNKLNELANTNLDFFTDLHSAEEKNVFFERLFETTEARNIPEERKKYVLNDKGMARSVFRLKGIWFSMGKYDDRPFADDENAVFKRFANVFEQSYTRFLDLKKAEAQAREAQIEAALERVRASAMAMHSSADLAETTKVIFQELEDLGIRTLRCGIGVWRKPGAICEIWTTTTSDSGEAVQVIGYTDLESHPALKSTYDAWKQQKNFSSYTLEGDDLKRYYDIIASSVPLPEPQLHKLRLSDERQYYYAFSFNDPEAAIYAFTTEPLTDESIQIFHRVNSVFKLTYLRYLDLQHAEGRAREAVQQASLDRVRAEIASMRTADDLQRITPLIWRELTTLGVPFFRCGVFIFDEETEHVHIYLSTPSGEAVAALHLKFDSTGLVDNAVRHWRAQKVYREEWDREQFIAWTQSLMDQRQIDSQKKYQAGEEAPERLVLQFMPFKQGMLYVGSRVPLSENEIGTSQELAKAFGIAYARYEDFQKLEAAKGQVEAALENLKTTQSQLVQAEKMASLGQLTAGIAHEIKNPLNFVNNFSELSIELAKEFAGELDTNPDKTIADMRKVLDELLTDLRTNSEKINEHGRRADSIVKSMMLHARGGAGDRQPTDVNALADEYLNLTYHGMRAKVPDFNVTMERDFGKDIGKVEMVPQEIGRVLLNLLGNAFDAVYERAGSGQTSYEPKVIVSTRKVENAVEIRVSDNGGGIPDAVREKIFEPFFTTKPAGSGTGLGLSLSYDIVTQGHGGTLSVESTEGKGATFTIALPASKRQSVA